MGKKPFRCSKSRHRASVKKMRAYKTAFEFNKTWLWCKIKHIIWFMPYFKYWNYWKKRTKEEIHCISWKKTRTIEFHDNSWQMNCIWTFACEMLCSLSVLKGTLIIIVFEICGRNESLLWQWCAAVNMPNLIEARISMVPLEMHRCIKCYSRRMVIFKPEYQTRVHLPILCVQEN